MEGSEVPKVPESTGQSTENKELQLKSAELAKATREKGMGILSGNFPVEYSKKIGAPFGGQYLGGGFIQGEEGTGFLIGRRLPYGLLHARGQERRQVWMASQYVPPRETEEVEEMQDVQKTSKFLGIRRARTVREPRKVSRETGRLRSHNGKHGENDWIQYDYLMKVSNAYDAGRRIGYVNMSIAVPPEIARQIDDQVQKNPYFPDQYFQKLYPDLEVGKEDTSRQLMRLEATEIEIIDERQRPRKQEVRKYPQPIPY